MEKINEKYKNIKLYTDKNGMENWCEIDRKWTGNEKKIERESKKIHSKLKENKKENG